MFIDNLFYFNNQQESGRAGLQISNTFLNAPVFPKIKDSVFQVIRPRYFLSFLCNIHFFRSYCV